MKHRLEEQELLRRIGELPREIQPPHDPWPAIFARIGQPRSAVRGPRLWVPLAAAASVMLVLILVLQPGKRADEPKMPVRSQVVQENGIHGIRPATPGVLLAGSEAEYQAAFREFIAVGREHTSLSPRTLETIETGWAELRAAETALAAALASHPDDRFLNTRMLELRARQLGFLRQLASLDQSNRRLTI